MWLQKINKNPGVVKARKCCKNGIGSFISDHLEAEE